jgi:hypothetical protein
MSAHVGAVGARRAEPGCGGIHIVEASLAAPATPFNAILISCLHLVALAAAGLLPLDAPPLSLFACPFRAATGLPCLGCGCLHAFAAVAHLQIRAAFLANPLGALAAIGGVLFGIGTALRLAGVCVALPRITAARARTLRIGMVAVVFANWVFVAVRSGP